MAGESGRCQHPCFAFCYQWISRVVDQYGGAQDRVRLLAGLTGRVVEIGAGNGLNFQHYLIAFPTFASHTQGSASPTTPPSASSDPSTSQAPAGNALPSIAVALSSLPDPCDAPVAATISPFRTVAAQPDDTSNQDGKGCHWFENGTYNTFDILYSTVGFQPETGSSPISVPGLPHAVKDRWGSSVPTVQKKPLGLGERPG